MTLQLDQILAIAGIGVLVAGIGAAFLLKSLWRLNGSWPVGILANAGMYVLMLSMPSAVILMLASIFVSHGPIGIGVLVCVFALAILIVKVRSRRGIRHPG